MGKSSKKHMNTIIIVLAVAILGINIYNLVSQAGMTESYCKTDGECKIGKERCSASGNCVPIG